MDTALIGELFKQGIGIVAAGVFFYLYIQERKRVNELTDRTHALGLESVKSQLQVMATVEKGNELIRGALQLVSRGSTV